MEASSHLLFDILMSQATKGGGWQEGGERGREKELERERERDVVIYTLWEKQKLY